MTSSGWTKAGPRKATVTLCAVARPKALRYCCGGIGRLAEGDKVEGTSGLQGSCPAENGRSGRERGQNIHSSGSAATSGGERSQGWGRR